MRNRRNALAVAALVMAAVLAAPSVGSASPARSAPARAVSSQIRAQAYPSPGTTTAVPATGITFRDISPSAAGAVQVTGSVSGAHALTVKAHRDGRGVTLQPRVAFAPGEQVTVRGLAVAGGRGDQYTFSVARPGRHPGLDLLRADGFRRTAGSASRSTRAANGPPYKTRPDLNPPPVSVTTPATNTAPGLLLTNPGSGAGVQIMDNTGQPIWYHGVAAPVVAGDLEKARYHGQDVLVWFEGTAPYGPGSYRGAWTMIDSTYRTVATIRATNGYEADIHEIEITPQGQAYLVIYNPVTMDLSGQGGSATANVLELVIQEVDIESGDLMFEWHSLDYVPVSETVLPIPPPDSPNPVDYIHGNSLETDTDGNLLVSGRNTSTVYKIRRNAGGGQQQGDVMWRLGGEHSDYTFLPAGEPGPSAQHDARRFSDSPNVISMFDNGLIRNSSRGVRYQLDDVTHTATRINERKHVPNHFSFAQGDYRKLSNGDDLVSWGITGLVTEYNPAGEVNFEATVTGGDYRTIREFWTGRPTSRPAVVVDRSGANDTVYVSWNGETDIASWEVRTGTSRSNLATVTTVPRDGFETSISVPDAPFVQVVAKTTSGAVLGSSSVVGVGPWFSEAPVMPVNGSYRTLAGNFHGGPADDVIFYAAGSAPDYLWTSTKAGFVVTRLPAVNGDYQPLVGDFVGDGYDDILWRSSGGGPAYLWRSDSGGFAISPVVVPAASVAEVLPHRAGHAEVLSYNPGSGGDAITSYRWPSGTGGPSTAVRVIHVNGSYQPIIGDFDGNGWADIFWYASGSTPDQYWRLIGNPGGSSYGQVTRTTSVNGTYTPLAGRFSSTGDNRDDILWYAPGGAVDYVWEGTSGATFVPSAHGTTFSGSPVLLRGFQDQVYVRQPGADGIIWVPNAHPDIVRPAGNSPIAAQYVPVVGDFDYSGRSSILWYAPGSSPETLFRARLG